MPIIKSREEVAKMLYDLKTNDFNQIFGVTFVKKDGTRRDMTCRFGVTKNLTGGGQKYDPADYELITVTDMKLDQYRMVNLATITELRINGHVVQVS